jgi:outer membrane protein OmpA-like peptidoglycan-associated protein
MVLCVLLPVLSFVASAADPNDRAGSKDPPLFTRMPGFYIDQFQALDFGRVEFGVARGKVEAVEGRQHRVSYAANSGVRHPSGLQVIRNYSNANSAAGGQTVYETEDGGTLYVTLKLVKGDKEFWTEVGAASNGMYSVNMVERQAMTQAVTANAAAWAGGLRDNGRVALYGIYFDTGKSDLKPESDATLREIARLLESDPALKVHVVGHTDNVGNLADNLKLSGSRAAAVVQALVARYKVAAARLTGNGVGPLAPVAPNDAETGRAKNRRVELVRQ